MAPRTAKAKKEVTSEILSGKKNQGRKITKNKEESSIEVKLKTTKKTEDYENQEINSSNQNGKLNNEIQNENKEMPIKARAKKQQLKTVILEDLQENVAANDTTDKGVNPHQEKPMTKARGKKAGNIIKKLPDTLVPGQENGDDNEDNAINPKVEKEPSAPYQRSRKGHKKNAVENLDEDNERLNNEKEEIPITTARGKKVQRKNDIVNSKNNQLMETDAEKIAEKVMTNERGRKGNKKVKVGKLEDELMDFDDIEAVEISSQEDAKPRGRGKIIHNKTDKTVTENIVSDSMNSAENTEQVEELIPKKERAKKTKGTVQSDKESLTFQNDNKTNEADKTKPKGRKPRKKLVAEEKEIVDDIKKDTVNIAPTQITTLNGDGDIEKAKGKVKGRRDANEVQHEKGNSLKEDAFKLPSSNDTKEQETNNSDTDASAHVATASANAEPQPKQAAKGKRSAPKKTTAKDTATNESQEVQEPPSKKTKREEKKPLKNKAVTDYEDIDFSNSSKNSQGQPWNLKICSWNVDGIRAWLTKGGLDYLKHEKPDILCLQEVKCSRQKIPQEAVDVPGYHPYWLCSDKDGYAGVTVYTIKMAMSIKLGLGDKELDTEGRIMTVEYEQFYLIATYVPNAGRKLITLPKRLRWNEIFHNYVKELDAKKPVIICGDMNVAHNEIDLANPKSNKRNAGFTEEERAGMTKLLNDGFVDTFRHLYPEQTGAYTFWTYMMNSRAKNVGWRLDYFIMSERLLPTLCDNVIRSEVFGSDHCPLALFLHLSSVPKIPQE